MSLLITLAFIVIITILAVGFAESVRLSRPAAASFFERARADQFARSGLERVIATLSQNTADTNRNWITRPGELVAGAPADDPATPVDERKVLSVSVPLHSGSAPAPSPSQAVLQPPNLNLGSFRDPDNHLLTDQTNAAGGGERLPVAWIYVRRSGQMDTNTSPVLSADDPLVGRYAYWTDDESSKVNYNIAWGKAGNPNPPGHPTRVDLAALTGFTRARADALHAFVTNVPANSGYRFFNTPMDARRLEKVPGNAGVAAALKANKFQVTHFNSDPNTTFFNEPRIVLTTRPDRAGWTYEGGQWVGVNGLPWPNGRPFYLRVLANEGASVQPNVLPTRNGPLDPGRLSRLGVERVSETIHMLALASAPHPSYLQRSDWPMVSSSASIQDKYYGNYPAEVRSTRLAELAINIIDYVRARESPQDLVEPIRGQFSATATLPNKLIEFTDSGSNSYMGISRTPHVTELGVWTGSATADAPMPSDSIYLPQALNGQIVYKFKWEFHLPKHYGLAEVDLSKLFVLFGATGALYTSPTQGYCAFKLDAPGAWFNPTNPGSPVVRAGEYAVYTHIHPVASGSGTPLTVMPAPRPTGLASFRLALSLVRGNTNLDIVPVAQGNPVQINSIPIDPPAVAEDAITTIETDDPRVNKQRGDWVVRASGNSLGAVNGRNSVGKPAANVVPPLAPGAPQRDTEEDGAISDASLYMPPPAGKAIVRPDGTIDDNTLGQVMSAGELGFVHTGIEGCLIVRFGALTSTVPPGVPWRTLRLQPNDAGTNVVPDWALIDLFTAPIAAPDASNKFVFAPHDTSFGGRVSMNARVTPFDLARPVPLAAVFRDSTCDATDLTRKVSDARAAELAGNIMDRVLAAHGKHYGYGPGYDSVGEMVEIRGVADEGEKSEELFRQVANLVSARGNVFSVYSVGQALKQTPGGGITVEAEQRIQAMVERYADPAGAIRFAPVYLRNLSP